jgi:hypothetical protein
MTDIHEFLSNKEHNIDLIYQVIKTKESEGLIPLFHSANLSLSDELSYGIVPTFGEWLTEILKGSVDDDLFHIIQEQDPVAFFDTTPGWISMKTARVLNTSVRNVSWNDIEKHGHLCIVFADPDDQEFMQAGNRQSDDIIEKSTFLGTDQWADYELPFGVERGDIYTKELVIPDYTLTGKSLVNFLQKYYPDANIVSDLKKKTYPSLK